MKLDVYRYSDNGESTLGLLFIDGKFECYTLEDEYRTVKVFGETRIPSGSYTIKLRTEGGHHERYKHKFTSIHKGMLWLQDVPNFEYVYIHIGNTDEDTDACILVGESPNGADYSEARVLNSANNYKRLYYLIMEAINAGERVWFEIKDNLQ